MMNVYGYDFAHSGVFGASVTGHTVKFSYVDLETDTVEGPAFDIVLSENYKVIECASSDLVKRFRELYVPPKINANSFDVLIPIEGGWLLLDLYHYNYGLQYNGAGSIVSEIVDFKYIV